MQKMVKMYTNKRNGETVTEREFKKLSKDEKKDFKPTPRANFGSFKN